jgi:ATP-dependent RNA helicase DDX10/DBP4
MHKINQNPQRYLKIQSSLQSICSEHQDVKYLAQRAIISYIRFAYKAHNKSIFNIKKINLDLFAKSFGLPTAPVISTKVNQPSESEEEEEDGEAKPKLTKIEQMRLKQKLKKQAKKEAKE